jgi:hypothetical protein
MMRGAAGHRQENRGRAARIWRGPGFRCSAGHPPEHGKHAVEEVEWPRDITVLDVTPGDGHAKRGTDLGRTPGGDPPVMKAVLARTTPTLGEIHRDRARRATNLCAKIRIPDAEQFERNAERPHEIETDFEGFEHVAFSLLSLSAFTPE